MALPSFGRIKGRVPREKEKHRVNERIRVPEVRLIDQNGGQVGVVPTRDALRMAKEVNLDLMEVAPNARPPVCKICDYGKFKYEQKKKESSARKKASVIKVKEIQLRPGTEEHDLDYKFKNARKFLEGGDKVKFSMLFRGRQIVHPEAGKKVLEEFAQSSSDVAIIEQYPKLEGRKMVMILAPLGSKSKKTSTGQKGKEKSESSSGSKDEGSSAPLKASLGSVASSKSAK